MNKRRGYQFFLLFFFSFISYSVNILGAPCGSNDIPPIIPRPQVLNMLDGNFVINRQTAVFYKDNRLKQLGDVIYSHFNPYFEQTSTVKGSGRHRPGTNCIELQLTKGFAEEAYELEVSPQKIICKASTETGMFYAVQSLLQSESRDSGRIKVPCMIVKDAPRFAWRGFMLDESRHFFGKKTVKQYLDIMSRLKMNRFHWHLTDEPGWRIEIKAYPLLTEIGGIGNWSDSKASGSFYTREDIKEIVAYAERLHILVIPEIDMPGHATAATRSYPEISGGGQGRWKGFTFHPTSEKTYEFIDKVLTEIVSLFPGPYIHIGGDEVHYGNQSWHTDPAIQKFIKENDLKDEAGLERYFVRRVCKIINSKGKKMIGWDEIVKAEVKPQDAMIMWWRQEKPEVLIQALEQGFEVILTPRLPCYLDFVQEESHQVGRRWDNKFNDLSTVYRFPGTSGIVELTEGYEQQIKGLQGSLWTERIKDKERLDFMTYPRLIALAEDGWTQPELKDFVDFENRIHYFLQYLKQSGIFYFNPFDIKTTPEPWGPEKADVISEG